MRIENVGTEVMAHDDIITLKAAKAHTLTLTRTNTNMMRRKVTDGQQSSEANMSATRMQQSNNGRHGTLQQATETATLDWIIHRTLQPNGWPTHLLLLITPSASSLPATSMSGSAASAASASPAASRHYKLHIIDRSQENGRLLDTTHITDDMLRSLSCSEAFHQHCIVLGSSHINFSTTAQRQALIANLINTLNGEGGRPCELEQRIQHATHYTNSKGSKSSKCFSPPAQVIMRAMRPNRVRLLTLIERINATSEPRERDLKRLFQFAEQHDFTLRIHPELCDQAQPPEPHFESGDTKNSSTDDNGVGAVALMQSRFHIECFVPHLGHVGCITLEAQQLQRKLQRHPKLLSRLCIVEDVCELVSPLPLMLIKCVRRVLACVGLEVLYDVLGKFIFNLYTHYSRKHHVKLLKR